MIAILMRLFVLLPYRFQLWMGSLLSRLAYMLLKSRRKVALTNLAHCFPALNESERKRLCRENFENVGMGFFETFAAWFMSDRRLAKIPYTWIGREHYEAALKTGKGIIILSGHFTSIEMVGRISAQWIPLSCVYKPSRNQKVDQLMKSGRMRYAKILIKHENMKAMVSTLKKGQILWFAPDQDFGRVRAEFVPFCGVEAATIVATSVLAKLGNALVLPMFMRRTENRGYELITLPAWKNFPSGNDTKDCQRYNDALSEYVQKYPEQYLWVHRRFKTVKSGQNIYCKS